MALKDALYKLCEKVLVSEEIPKEWNTGYVTALWKGKGDRENLNNFRGITTSSAIGTIIISRNKQ